MYIVCLFCNRLNRWIRDKEYLERLASNERYSIVPPSLHSTALIHYNRLSVPHALKSNFLATFLIPGSSSTPSSNAPLRFFVTPRPPSSGGRARGTSSPFGLGSFVG
jgi:hypothetical protein